MLLPDRGRRGGGGGQDSGIEKMCVAFGKHKAAASKERQPLQASKQIRTLNTVKMMEELCSCPEVCNAL